MTAVLEAPVTAPGVERAVTRELFVPVAVSPSVVRRAAGRLRWPLGIYTTPAVLAVLWQVASKVGWLSANLAPAPTVILHAGWELYQRGELVPSVETSLGRAGVGLAIGLVIGVNAGIVGGLLRSGEYLFNGVFQILHTIPLLAILPLMIVWFGIGELNKVLLIAFGAAVPMYLNLFAAIRGVDHRLVEMARSAGAGRLRLIRRVLLPGALPGFLVGLRFSLGYSVLGLVAAELVNADQGIGFLINRAQTYQQTDQVFFGLMIYAVLGLTADQIVRVLERVLLAWRPSYEAS
ncbi:MAG: transporter permease [Marmoricola sp.]|nr:transporter permease [Marmoricola sp.]